MKPTICRACGSPFVPIEVENQCWRCNAEATANDFLQSTPTKEPNEHPEHTERSPNTTPETQAELVSNPHEPKA